MRERILLAYFVFNFLVALGATGSSETVFPFLILLLSFAGACIASFELGAGSGMGRGSSVGDPHPPE
jgi:hypothetical protein